ncbi:hypothetical protein chiPu_0030861, partial [Chiloscyllium punctatum]|nr:hypothetical protein [Chiloscyllium punctatum]
SGDEGCGERNKRRHTLQRRPGESRDPYSVADVVGETRRSTGAQQ